MIDITDSIHAGLEKLAGNWMHKQITTLARKGDIKGANKLIKEFMASGHLKITPEGSQIRHLGAGAEGPATMVYGAKDNPLISVRKAYDRGGPIFDKELLGRKHNIWRRSQAAGDKRLAKLHSKKIRKGKGGTPYTIMEYIKGKETRGPSFATKRAPDDILGGMGFTSAKIKGSKGGSKIPYTKQNVLLGDVATNPGNVLTTKKGKERIIDFLPTTRKTVDLSLKGQTPGNRRIRRLMRVGTKRHVTGDLNNPKVISDLQHAGSEYIRKVQANPKAWKAINSEALAQRAQATTMGDLYGITRSGISPSVYGPSGIRQANVKRTLQGLGPARKKGK